MLMDSFLTLLASIEDNGGFKNCKTTDGKVSQLKLICDAQTYEIITQTLAGLLTKVSETKSQGLCYTIEIGEVN